MVNKTINVLTLVTLTIFSLLFLISCGGGEKVAQTNLPGKLVFTYQGANVPVADVKYTKNGSNAVNYTDADGTFIYDIGDTLTFSVGQAEFNVAANAELKTKDLAPDNADTGNNLNVLFANFDADNTPANGVQLSADAADLDPTVSTRAFQKQVYMKLGTVAAPAFKPSLGINLEAPQAEADTAGNAMPFVDMFRTARPFSELSNNLSQSTEVDENGWPTQITPDTGRARTKLLQGTAFGAIPAGDYYLLWEGSGRVDVAGGIIQQVSPLPQEVSGQGRTLRLQPVNDPDNPEANAINIVISQITPDSYIKNIRLVMPGGTCKDVNGKFNPFIRVLSQNECPANTTYVSFVERLNADREAIIFNPDYLDFLKDFKVVRMMNFMESSPGISACRDATTGVIDRDCVFQADFTWNDRAKMSDASWGGSGRTAVIERKGVPVEVLVELANQLGADPWFNLPHYANDDYVTRFAAYVLEFLKPELRPHIEYSNETWNSGFLGFYYMQFKGVDAGLTLVPPEFQGTGRDANYFARLRYYSRRSVEIFKLWERVFDIANERHRLIRILGTSQGDIVLSRKLLEFEDAPDHVDALAMAPYFFGCIDRTGYCASNNAPKVLSEVTSVDDIFDVIDQPANQDPSALEATINKIQAQATVAQNHNVQLVAYEGGQHLTIMGSMGSFDRDKKKSLRDLFKAANRDPRMKERYRLLLDGWKNTQPDSTALFMLYTLPQTFYEFGNWGLKEHLNKTRSESPKYDATMDFQEAAGACWWENCEVDPSTVNRDRDNIAALIAAFLLLPIF
jgi:hypothetical protein